MNMGWKTRTLDDACQFSNGLWKGEKPPFVNVGVIRNTNFTKEGTLDDSDITYLDVEAKKLEKRRLQFGDIILEKSGGGPKQPVGRVALFDKEDGNFSFSNFTAALRVLDPHELDFRFLHKFLYWTYLSGVTEGMQSHSTGIRNLDGDAYKAIKINIPPLPEQQRIVGILDEAFKGIAIAKANAEKNLQNARALFESQLDSVFTKRAEGWAEKTLEDICLKITDGEHLRPKVTSSGVPFLSAKDVLDHDVTFINPLFISQTDALKFRKRCNPETGDILIVSRGATVGRTCVVKTNNMFCLLGSVILLKISPTQSSQFISYALKSPAIRDQLMTASEAAAQQAIYLRDIKPLKIGCPSRAEQQTIVSQLDALTTETQRLESIYQQNLTALDALKKSLLHQAFSGEL